MQDRRLFIGCFTALVATAFGFIVRTQIIDQWGIEFGLDDTQKGEIFGAGLWPFAISIVLFSLIIDRIGYGKAMAFAFACHIATAVLMIVAKGYWGLYVASFIGALGNGTVEAAINPVVATMFSKEKTKWLNILHAGWPGGLVLAGLLALGMGTDIDWRYKVGLIFLPTVAYGLILLGCPFPQNERVKAGVPFKSMLKEAGMLGALIVSILIVFEVTRVFEQMGYIFQGWSDNSKLIARMGIVAAITLGFGAYVRSLGRPMFIFLVLVMIPLAITELGTDSWITPLMEPQMTELGLQAGWVLVYTSAIMMVLRFFAGPIVHKLSPLGLLAISSLIAAVGLVALSKATGITILAAATLYGLGKTFFWPTMLGVVAEQFPKGGALTLNTISGVGMLGVGVVGAALLGNIQDKEVDRVLLANLPDLHAKVAAPEKISIFGAYRPLDQVKVKSLGVEETASIKTIQDAAKKNALTTVAVFPVVMLVCYLGLMAYFRARGGYQAEELPDHGAEGRKIAGGAKSTVH